MCLIRCFTVSLCLLGLAGSVSAQDVSVAGKWVGTWKNSLKESGKSVLDLKDEAGKFSGTWDDTTITGGKRINKNTVELTAKNADHTYQITISVNNGKMKLTYLASNNKGRGSYTGESALDFKK